MQSEGWQQVLLPYLTDKLNQSFPDPTEFKKEEEFLYAAKTASVFKKVIAELLGGIQQYENQRTALLKKESSEVKDPFSIGGETT